MTTLMWKQYKKTALFMQTGIVLTCVAAYFAAGGQLIPVLALFIVMQLAAVLGAGWGYSIKYRKERANYKRNSALPLERKR